MDYPALIQSISEAHRQAQAGAAGAVNRHLVIRNWLIGAYLVEFEQMGAERAAYGHGLLKQVAGDLRKRDVPGTSPDMLERMRLFYEGYPQLAVISAPLVRKLAGGENPDRVSAISAPPVRKTKGAEPRPLPAENVLRFSWTHLTELIRIVDPWKRAFYENECLRGNWSKRQLQRQIGSLLYERTGLSTDKAAVIDQAREHGLGTPQQIADLIRDPYILEFAGLAEKSRYLEKDLETALLDHLQAFLLELGTGFCFEARQKRITVGDEHDYLDLVFYHRVLRCHLLIDLKTRAFRHGDAGQMNFYLNYWKDKMMTPGDEPPVGLILCTDKKETRVSYATAGMDEKLFVSRYLIALPRPEELQALIDEDSARWFQQQQKQVE